MDPSAGAFGIGEGQILLLAATHQPQAAGPLGFLGERRFP
jgi:hypothetical protein